MPSLAVRSFAVFAWLAPLSLLAQQPRFHLPAQTVDYHLPKRALGTDCGCCPSLPGGNTPSPPDPTGNERATLGRVLFHDPLLSKNRSTSCASCHHQARGFADGRRKSRGFDGRPTARNSMSIVDLAEHSGPFFWDGRVARLEEMVLRPIEDPIEMGLELETLLVRLRVEPGYPELFGRAFGDPKIDVGRVAAALATFVRAIATVGSKYDAGLAVAKDPCVPFPNFNAAENRGKAKFFGVGESSPSCATCHIGRQPLPCGRSTWDPTSFASGAMQNNGLDNGRRGRDTGLGRVTGRAEDAGRFRAPSLRNVALTAPYMHDGRFATLREVVDFYAAGVKDHPNLDATLGGSVSSWGESRRPPPPPHPLASIVVPRQMGIPMSSTDRADLVAFLETLTDHELVRDPRFADPFR